MDPSYDPLPVYSSVDTTHTTTINRSNTIASTSTDTSGARYSHWHIPIDRTPPLNVQTRSKIRRSERYLYEYNVSVDSIPLRFLISVEPKSGKPHPGDYSFSLSMKVNAVERTLAEAVDLKLSVDPRQLEFIVFMFPGKASFPAGCLYSLRVWLRVNGVDHRIFGEDDLWVAKDPDFNSVANASFARLKSVDDNTQTYQAFVGNAHVNFFVRCQRHGQDLYKYTLEYEAGGVGGVLYDDWSLRLECDPRTVSFVIYTVPITSIPPGASHRVRFWMRSPTPFPSPGSPTGPRSLPFADSYIYQRLWKSDSFKVGAQLNFGSLGSKMTMGVAAGGPQTIVSTTSPDNDGEGGYGYDKQLSGNKRVGFVLRN